MAYSWRRAMVDVEKNELEVRKDQWSVDMSKSKIVGNENVGTASAFGTARIEE